MNKFFQRTFIGFIVVFLVTALITGGIGDAMGVLFLAVVCTAGASLIIIVPVCYGVGSLVIFIGVPLLEKVQDSDSVPVTPLSLAGSYKMALSTYVQKSKEAGYTDEWIQSKCKENGAAMEEIELAFKSSKICQ